MRRFLLQGGCLLLLFGCSAKKPPEPLPLVASPGITTHVPQKKMGAPSEPTPSLALEEEEPEIGDDLWQRLFQNYRFPERDVYRPEVQTQLRYYLKKRDSGFFDRVQERARPFLYMIVEEIEKAGLPAEIALLPVVESAFKTTAYSRAGASGLWQFIRSTGKRYGLWRNHWIDMRRDPLAATQAAIRYLKELHAMFGDWYLALAAYNCGEKRVEAAVERNRRRGLPTDFWHLDLPRETEAYVPRLIAISHIFKNASRYGIALKPIPNRPLFATIRIDGPLDLEVAAQLAGLSFEEIYHLNASYRRGVIPPFGGRLLLPLERASDFKVQLAALPPEKRWRGSFRVASRSSKGRKTFSGAQSALRRGRLIPAKYVPPRHYRYHRVKRGEHLAAIARHYDTTIAELKRLNHLRRNTLYVGELLKVPVKTTPTRPSYKIYRVRRGDTLASIARRYGTSVRRLKEVNRLRSGHIYVGQRLKVPAISARKTAPKLKYHYVRRGETLFRIARRYGVSVEKLKRWNGLRHSRELKAGQRLKIYL